MKKIVFIFLVFSSFTLFAQDFENDLEIKKQIWKDSVYFNRFNKGNYQIGGTPNFIFIGGELGEYLTFGYALNSEFGYFIKNRLALFMNNKIIYFDNKIKNNKTAKAYHAYSRTYLGLRYYFSPKRFTFFTQALLGHSYHTEDNEAINGFSPISFSSFNFTAGLGVTFSFNLFDISLGFGYSLPFYYSKEVERDRVSYILSRGLIVTSTLFFTF